MILISFLNNFCDWWWFWWLVPFLLGLLLGWAIWGKLQNRINELEEENNDCRIKYEGLENKYIKTHNDFKDCKNRRLVLENELENYRNKNASLEADLSGWNAKYASIENKLFTTNNSLTPLENELILLKSKLSKAETDLVECRKNRNLLADEFDGLKQRLIDIEADLNDCNKGKTPLENELKTEKERYANLLRKFNELEKQKPVNISNDKTITGIASAGIAGVAGPGLWAKLKTDNLQIIEGIGPKMNEVLNDNGVNNWENLATKTPTELRAILDKYADKYQIIDPTEWPVQASYAARGDWDGLIGFQSSDGSNSKAKTLLIRLGIIKED